MKKITLSLSLIFATFFVVAQHSLLWKVEGEDIKTSYIFGTFHIFPKEKFEITPKVEKAFASSRQLVMELDMGDGIEMKMMQLAVMKDGAMLNDFLDEQELAILDSAFKANGMTMAMFKSWKPFLITSLFYNQYMENGVASFELAFQKMALEAEMPIQGLETVERQMRIFDAIPYQDQADDLIDIVTNYDKYKALFDEMVAAYLSEDIAAMYELTEREMNNVRELELLLNQRNKEWIPKMEQMMQDQPTFFAVGAGHLGGENGLIKLLEERGYIITPVID